MTRLERRAAIERARLYLICDVEQIDSAPFAEIDVLRQSGLLKLLVPVEDGGLGGRWTDALEVTRTIASGDGSIGQLIGYHYVNSQTPELAGTRNRARPIAGRWRSTIGSLSPRAATAFS